jgi:hypothetical protein
MRNLKCEQNFFLVFVLTEPGKAINYGEVQFSFLRDAITQTKEKLSPRPHVVKKV